MNVYLFFRAVLRLLRQVVWVVLDQLAVFDFSEQQRRIDNLILVRVDAIGDFVLWLSSAQSLRHYYSKYRLVLICNQAVGGLARSCGLFDEVVPLDLAAFVRNPYYRWRTVRVIRRFGAAVAIQPTHSRVFLTGDALVRASGATVRVGSCGDLAKKRALERRVSNRWYTRLVVADPKPLMELERNAEFLIGLGIQGIRPAVAEIPKLTELGPAFRLAGDYYVVFPGASRSFRMWPVEHFAAVGRSICENYGWRMVICGTESESELAKAVIDLVGLADSVNLAGRSSLPEFIQFVRGARLLIGNETSAVHIAAAVKTPSVCLLGGGHYGRFMPYSNAVIGMKPVPVFIQMECFGCSWRCVKPRTKGAAMPCISAISVDAVIRAAGMAIREGAI